jgi:hypothetical protein
MTRFSKDFYDKDGNLLNGFDYDLQCWVKEGLILRCGHKSEFNCDCVGRIHEGEPIKDVRKNKNLPAGRSY